jgi:hypothetical protein
MTVHKSDAPTLRDMKIPVALVVGGTEELISAVSEAALSAQVLVAQCGTADATNTAAQMRPLVIVMPEDVYESDPPSFDELARDVRARILQVSQDFDAKQLQREFIELMNDAESNRPSWIDGLKPSG